MISQKNSFPIENKQLLKSPSAKNLQFSSSPKNFEAIQESRNMSYLEQMETRPHTSRNNERESS